MEYNMCVLMDFENVAAGAEKEGHGRFDTRAVMTRLKEKGRILIARSYGDWGRFAKYKQDMLEQAVQAVELTSYRGQEKNRADIALAVDAMELAFNRSYIDTFVLLSGDSDFTPLVLRLRELNKRVVGIGTRRSSSRLLVESCDEFIFYESIKRGRVTPAPAPVAAAAAPDVVESLSKDDTLALLVETMEGLQKDEPGPMLAGRVKQSLLRKLPTFDETEYGYSGFARFLEAAQERGLVILSKDEKAGGYRVDLPTDTKLIPDEEEVAEAASTPLLQGEAERLREVLAGRGVDPLDALRRHLVVHEFCDHVTERARRKKRNTLIYTVGDVARRTRNSDPPVLGVQVRSVLQAVFEAGELLHADGKPIRKESAPFAIRHDAEEMLRVLRSYYVWALLDEGETLGDSRALSTLLWGDQDHLLQAEELVAWVQHEHSGREGEGEEPEAEAEAATVEPGEEQAEESGADNGGAEGSGRRRRRPRRGNRRRHEGAGEEATGEEATGEEATGEEATGEEATGEEATGEEATGEEATGEEATGEEAVSAEATGEEAVSAEATVEEPAVEEPAVEEPAAEQPAAEEPAAEEPAPKRRRTVRRKADTAKSDTAKADTAKADTAKADTAAAASSAEAPKPATRRRTTRKTTKAKAEDT